MTGVQQCHCSSLKTESGGMTYPIRTESWTQESELYVYGASGHGKVVAEIANSTGHHVRGFIDDNPALMNEHLMKIPVAGAFEYLVRRSLHSKVAVALGIGDNSARCSVAERCTKVGIPLIKLIHQAAIVSPSAAVGDGTVVMACVVVNADAVIGNGVILNTAAVVEHDCKIGDYAHLSPHSTMGGASQIGKMSWLGMSASIINGISVGAETIVGAGAVVIRNLPDGVVAVGVPARISHHMDRS